MKTDLDLNREAAQLFGIGHLDNPMPFCTSFDAAALLEDFLHRKGLFQIYIATLMKTIPSAPSTARQRTETAIAVWKEYQYLKEPVRRSK